MTSPEQVKGIDNMAKSEKQNRSWLHSKLQNYLWKIKGSNAYGSTKKQDTIAKDLFLILSEFQSNIDPEILKKGYKGKFDIVPYTGKDTSLGKEIKAFIHCPIHSKTVCVGIKNGIMCKRCFDKLSTKEREKVV